MKITLYNDQPELLHPFTHFRKTWDVSVGGRTLKQFLKTSFPNATIEYKDVVLPENISNSDAIHISGRALPSDELIENLKANSYKLKAIEAPWELITHHKQILIEEIERRIKYENLTEVRPMVYSDGNITLPDTVITKTDTSPIIIAHNTNIGHHIVLEGPLIIESRCTIKNFSDIKISYIGQVCKIGGEVSASSFFGYSNKVHHGFVGDSAIAEWVNFGAGATTSNMKNTYGKVRIDRGNGKEETDLQFLGSLIGDHSKIAINASLMTGTILGCAVHAYGLIHGTVPSFTQIYGQQKTELPLDVAIKIAERMMTRRDKKFSEIDKKDFEEIFSATVHDRTSSCIKQNTKLSFN